MTVHPPAIGVTTNPPSTVACSGGTPAVRLWNPPSLSSYTNSPCQGTPANRPRTRYVPFVGVSGSTFTASAFTSVRSMFLISQIALRVASRGKAISLVLTVVILDPMDPPPERLTEDSASGILGLRRLLCVERLR